MTGTQRRGTLSQRVTFLEDVARRQQRILNETANNLVNAWLTIHRLAMLYADGNAPADEHHARHATH